MLMEGMNCVMDIRKRVTKISRARQIGELLGVKPRREELLIGWNPPTVSWFKLNTNGSVQKARGVATSRGVIHDDIGNWLRGFFMKMSFCIVTATELWGLYQGLELAWKIGIRRIQVEVDNKRVVKLIYGHRVHASCLILLIASIHHLLSRNWQVNIGHVYCKSSKVANCLAVSFPLVVHELVVSPLKTHALLRQDALGICYPRMVPFVM
ncbi:nucleic acid binding protein, putative [Ricinus communis]|uniref:Nucleic acid binding protein, putative n=1 Tax=Ricinus communis TaxID=3988 RepID=B9SAL2_RICCO|nr:nucleic acid binding protein, putative [Ricinus communis]